MIILDNRDMDKLFTRIRESSVDFPREGLDPNVWTKQNVASMAGQYTLRPDVKNTVLTMLRDFPGTDLLLASKAIWIIGSITTNLHEDESDIDVHIQMKTPAEFSEELRRTVIKWSRKSNKFAGNHPIEIYIQDNPDQDLATSDGVYDVIADTWLKGPGLVDEDYNPYEIFADVMDKVREFAQEADIKLGELKRDVIDYAVMRDAYQRLPDQVRVKLRAYLDAKLEEVDATINELLKDKKEWIEYRRSTAMTDNPDDARKDAEIVRTWKDVNATFKFLQRYGLLRVITELEQVQGDDKTLAHSDVPAVAKIVGA